MGFNPFGFDFSGKVTANANTAYTLFVPPGTQSVMTLLEFLQVSVSTTAQTLTVMRPLSAQNLPGSAGLRCSCYLTAAAAASQAVININQDPGVYTAYTFGGSGGAPRTANNTIAGSDYVAFQYPDGTWGTDTVSSVSTLAVTLSNNLATGGLAIGAPVWFFGVTTNVNPYNAIAHPQYRLAASTIVNFGSEGFPFVGTLGLNEPLLLYVDNATAASFLERCSGTYANRGGPYASYA